jgi:outer membrane protein assembly factor BamD (BamD/ComL family)
MFTQLQQFQQDFQQLGQDLQSGNTSAAQSDFVTLQNDLQQTSSTSASTSTSTSQSSSPLAQAFNQLAQDLQSGNLSGAQKDYATIQQDFQSQVSQTHHHHHSSGSQQSQASQLFAQLGQDLQSGNLSNAQSDFTSLQQVLQGNGSTSALSGSTPGSLSITA